MQTLNEISLLRLCLTSAWVTLGEFQLLSVLFKNVKLLAASKEAFLLSTMHTNIHMLAMCISLSLSSCAVNSASSHS